MVQLSSEQEEHGPWFRNFDYIFSSQELDCTNWSALLKQKGQKRAELPPSLLKRRLYDSRINRLTLAKTNLESQQRRGSVGMSYQQVNQNGNDLNDYVTSMNATSRHGQSIFSKSNASRNRNSMTEMGGSYASNSHLGLGSDHQSEMLSPTGSVSPKRRPDSIISKASLNSGQNQSSPQNKRKMQEAEDSGILKLKQLRKYKRLVQDPIKVDTPFDLRKIPKYKKFPLANIIKQDHDRNGIINYFISNVYKIFVLLQDRQWQEAFLTCYANI